MAMDEVIHTFAGLRGYGFYGVKGRFDVFFSHEERKAGVDMDEIQIPQRKIDGSFYIN